ncbi:hypothetical protein DERF_014221 [Dermatophagoides farinae]|uniref:Uncharacterized protein n=1 Tax=Dermatophagoides farinae TaxID=6954 RepID=A0A922HLQ6_DERFA|nr:hypothetical protein DERF_014221 [Dermatophagoides farinae]
MSNAPIMNYLLSWNSQLYSQIGEHKTFLVVNSQRPNLRNSSQLC